WVEGGGVRRGAARSARQTQSRHSSSLESCRRCISLVLTWSPVRTTIALTDFVGLLRNSSPATHRGEQALGKPSGQATGADIRNRALAPAQTKMTVASNGHAIISAIGKPIAIIRTTSRILELRTLWTSAVLRCFTLSANGRSGIPLRFDYHT